MASDKYHHMKDLFSIQERVNRLFEDVLGKESGETAFHKSWSPLVDIYETEHEFVVIAELPEVLQEDIDIRVESNVLLIQGERKFNRDKAKDSFHRVERKYGFFRRSFLLPSSVDQGSIQANLKDGILRIVLPKRAEAEPLRVDIA
ncbi:MAG: Hsp20/alpha crystallin family protein [bacterium]